MSVSSSPSILTLRRSSLYESMKINNASYKMQRRPFCNFLMYTLTLTYKPQSLAPDGN